MNRVATINQLKVLDFIRSFISEHTYSPTVREIGGHFSITVKAVADVLAALRKKGYIRWEPGKPRTLGISEGDS